MASSVLAPQNLGVVRAGAEPVPGYRLVERLGAGGAGEVWCAEGPGGLPVALKLVRLSCKLGGRELDTLRILRAVRHPNLLAYFGAWTTDDLLIIGMELAECSLWDYWNRLSAKGLAGIPLSELLAIMGEVAKLIDFLHQPRHELDGKIQVAIHHRDIKPQNIMLLGGGVKVADFGLCCLYDQYAKSRTQDGLTYPYAAPEVFRGQVSDHSDQYSLAVTYCVLRGGRLPFVGPPASVMHGHLFEPPDLSMLPLPEQPIVHRALAKDPVDRWPTCRQFIEALGACPDAGSPETIAADDRDTHELATGWSRQAVPSGDRSWVTPTGYALNSSAADDRSSYQLDSFAGTPVASSRTHLSQAMTMVIPADRPERAWSHPRSTLISSSVGLLILLGVGSWTMLAPKVPRGGLSVIRFNAPGIVRQSTGRAQPAAGEIHSLDPTASVLASVPPPLGPILVAAGPTLHPSAARARRPDPRPQVLDESAEEIDTEPGPELRSEGLVYGRSPELRAQSLRLIRLVTLAIGKLRAQTLPASQVVDAEHARAVPRPPAAEPLPAAARSLVPDRRQSATATLRIVLPDTIEIQAGGSKEVPVAADRGGVEGPVLVQLEGLPRGVLSPPVMIPARINRAVFCLRAEIETPSVELTLRVTARRGSQQTEQPITLIVHANPSLVYRAQGNQLLASGKPAEAIGVFTRALEMAPGDPIVLNNRGVAHALLSQHEAAVADYTAAIRLRPQDPLVRHNRGVAYARQGNMTRALLDFDTAIRLNPNYAPVYRSRAELYDRCGSPARAAADRMKADQIQQTPSPTTSDRLTAEGMVEFSSLRNMPSLTDPERPCPKLLSAREPIPRPSRTSGSN